MARIKQTQEPLPFDKKLILNQYLLRQFGVSSFEEFSKELSNPRYEAKNDEGLSLFYDKLCASFPDKLKISTERLETYDLNISRHTQSINDGRDEKITWKYFQYLALLFTEYYLDEYFNNKEILLNELNEYTKEFNTGHDAADRINQFYEGDLNKIAFWCATGSGKTLLMHINYLQYIHYSKGHTREDDCTYILLTPSEGLSAQHIGEFHLSGISAASYQKQESRLFANDLTINVLENTKLGDKDGDKTVAVSRFGCKNIVFVDEGHRGSSGETWLKYRDKLCRGGFSFEYSATFGQAINKDGKDDKGLVSIYSKCILFDYSYKYFYKDGYGKDYNILNLSDDSESNTRRKYLVACLLSFYQQKRLYKDSTDELRMFNIENPLLVFVGGSVNAVRTENKREVSDVIDILLFIQDFISNSEDMANIVESIKNGQTGLLDKNQHDIFSNAFTYLNKINKSAQSVYQDILSLVFNCSSLGAVLHLERLKGTDGEIRLRLGENKPFGVINVGDADKLLKLCQTNGLNTFDVVSQGSLFQAISQPDSTINVLIGAKKFSEGWNSWRVSTMGLMNVGKSEGSEIIQLFGRGIRLKGYEMSLKRSKFCKQDIKASAFISLVETLNVFGVRANYMENFKTYLEREGIETKPLFIKLPVIRNKDYKESKLKTLRLKDGIDFKKNAPKLVLKKDTKYTYVTLDCYTKVQFQASIQQNAIETIKHEGRFDKIHLCGLDYNYLYFELLQYKNDKTWYNLSITKGEIIELLSENSWYKLFIPEQDLNLHNFNDYQRWTRIALALLKKYCDRLYYWHKNQWEKNYLEYAEVDENYENFLEDDGYTVNMDNLHNDVGVFITNLVDAVKRANETGSLIDFKTNPIESIGAIILGENLYNPLMYLSSKAIGIKISPVSLNESEFEFIKKLKAYLENKKEKFSNTLVYIIRNISKKGVGFFDGAGFYPDFIMWIIKDGIQHITFIDPHGARNMPFDNLRVRLHINIKNIEKDMGNKQVKLNSVILSPTRYDDFVDKSKSKETWIENNVLFMGDADYIEQLFSIIEPRTE